LYKERYSRFNKPEKFHLIPNGCDLDEYEKLKTRERKIISDRFLILSAAWGFRKDYRDIAPFFLALDVFLNRHPDAKENIEVVLLGDSLSTDYQELLSNLKLNDMIRCIPSAHREALVDWLWKADLFVLIQPINNTTAISGTLYEYWATGKAPVLLISEAGASSTLIEEYQLGQHFHFEQVEQIANYMETIFDAYQRGRPIWIEREGVQKFDRKLLAKRMNEVWQEAINHSSDFIHNDVE
jgi:glycosyltransferase involved in cell wall biosynthesis